MILRPFLYDATVCASYAVSGLRRGTEEPWLQDVPPPPADQEAIVRANRTGAPLARV